MPTTTPAHGAMHADLQRSGLSPSDMGCTEKLEPFSQQVIGYTIPYYLPDGTPHPQMHRWRNTVLPPNGARYGQPSREDILKAGGTERDVIYPYLNPFILGPTLTWDGIAKIAGKRLVLVEGEKKAVLGGKLLKRFCVGFGGCWNAMLKVAPYEGATPIFELHPVIRGLLQPGDTVDVVFDADVLTNPDVNRAAGTLRRCFIRLGITPSFVVLPAASSGKTGLDDWLLTLPAGTEGVAYDALPRVNGMEYGQEFTEDNNSLWEWLGLITSKDRPLPIESNVGFEVERYERYAGRLWYDVIQMRVWHTLNDRSVPEQWSDSKAYNECQFVQTHLGLLNMKRALVEEGFLYVPAAKKYHRNPLIDDIESEQWDGTPRLEEMFITGFGAPDTGYAREVGRCWMLSAIARAYDPGCQVDTMLILEGKQGIGKSQALKILGGRWYVEMRADIGEKDFILAAHSGWIADIIELGAFKYADFTRIKGEITARVDTIRVPYGRAVEDRPRRFVLTGTTNTRDYLRDETGNRRFWPIECNAAQGDTINLAWVRQFRGQLLAEALARYRAGESWWSNDPSILAETAAVQNARMEHDPWEEQVTVILANASSYRTVPTDFGFKHFAASSEILYALGVPVERQNSGTMRRLNHVMAQINGWDAHRYNSPKKPLKLSNGGESGNARGYVHDIDVNGSTGNVVALNNPSVDTHKTKF